MRNTPIGVVCGAGELLGPGAPKRRCKGRWIHILATPITGVLGVLACEVCTTRNITARYNSGIMRQWGLNVIGAVCGIVAILAAMLWVKSIHVGQELVYTTRVGNCFSVSTQPGGLFIAYSSPGRDGGRMFPPFEPYPDGWCVRSMPYGVPIDVPVEKSQIPQSPYASSSSVVIRSVVVHSASSRRWTNFDVIRQAVPLPQSAFGNFVQSDVRALVIPLWAIIGVCLIGVVIRGRVICQRIGRAFRHACLTCGYNLTANISGVCPECGSQIGHKRSGFPGLHSRSSDLLHSVDH
jgi:hypothetical protein